MGRHWSGGRSRLGGGSTVVAADDVRKSFRDVVTVQTVGFSTTVTLVEHFWIRRRLVGISPQQPIRAILPVQ